MKKLFPLLVLLIFASASTAAEDGTGQGKSYDAFDSYITGICSQVLKAEDGTGQSKAEDGTGQNKAEDGTGQGKAAGYLVNQCKAHMSLK